MLRPIELLPRPVASLAMTILLIIMPPRIAVATTANAAVPIGGAGEGRLVLQENFRPDGGGLPEGWELWTPEPAMQMRVEPGRGVSYHGSGSVRMTGAGNPHAKGSLRKALTGIDRDKYYRLQVAYMTEGVSHANNCIYPLVSWGAKRKFQLMSPIRNENGWSIAELIMRMPENAVGPLTVELFAGWIPEGSVYWGQLSVTELPTYEPPSNPVRVAVIDSQPPKIGSLADNADFYAKEIDRACADGRPDVIVLPEHFNTTKVAGASEVTIGSDYLSRLQGAARTHAVNVVGSITLREDGFLFNTAILIDRQGKIAGKYRKSHLATPEALFSNISRGDELEILETDFGKVGVLVCWDYHFPEAVRTLVLKGAEILLVPLAGDGRLLEHGVNRGTEYAGKAIALDNRVPIVFAVTKGSTKDPSMIINARAKTVARSSDGNHIISAVVDTRDSVIQWTGSDFKSVYRSDRRPELYGKISEGAVKRQASDTKTPRRAPRR